MIQLFKKDILPSFQAETHLILDEAQRRQYASNELVATKCCSNVSEGEIVHT